MRADAIGDSNVKRGQLHRFLLSWSGLFLFFWGWTILSSWRSVVLIPAAYSRPAISMEYWTWYTCERIPVAENEAVLIAVTYAVKWTSLPLALIGIIINLFDAKKTSTKIVFKRCLGVNLVGVASYAVLFFIFKTLGEPYYLWMLLTPTSMLTLAFIFSSWLAGRSFRNHYLK